MRSRWSHLHLALLVAALVIISLIGSLARSAYADSPPILKANAWLDPLPIPPVAVTKYVPRLSSWADYYEINMTAHDHQFSPAASAASVQTHNADPAQPIFGPATVWTYGQGKTAVYLGPTIVAKTSRPVVVKWINDLPTDPNAFPLKDSIDSTIGGSDVPTGAAIPHLHGGHTAARFDGTPNEWWTADGQTGPDFVTDTFTYVNDQPASLQWYHDHTMGATRLKPYLGLAAAYLLFDGVDNGTTILNQKVPAGYGTYHLPIVLQDKMFNPDGTLFYPTQGVTAVHPIWVPEFFGDTPVINGRAYPFLDAQPRRYRLRFLNGSQARFYNLHFDLNGNSLAFWIIGSEGGLLPAPVEVTELLIAPGERFDAIADFTGIPLGSVITMTNDAPAPYPGGGEVVLPELMQIRIDTPVPANDPDRTVPPAKLKLPVVPRLTPTPGLPPRDVVLKENEDPITGDPLEVLLNGYHFMDPVTDFVKAGTTETWRWINLTPDAHPMHMHLVTFQVVDRQAFRAADYWTAWQTYLASGRNPALKPNVDDYTFGPLLLPAPEEMGYKDTVKAYPSLDPNNPTDVTVPGSYSYVTRVRAKFDLPPTALLDFDWKTKSFGKWVYHCHILEHEENDMMRPFEVVW